MDSSPFPQADTASKPKSRPIVRFIKNHPVLAPVASAILGAASLLVASSAIGTAIVNHEENKPIRANDVFSEVAGYEIATQAQLTPQEQIAVNFLQSDFNFYRTHSRDIAQTLEHLPPIENEESVRLKSLRNIIPIAYGIKNLTTKALVINQWGNRLIDYDMAKLEHGTNDPDWFRESLDTAAWGKGVCIDQALLKYEALRLAGFPEDKMAILILGNKIGTETNAKHAVVLLSLEEGDYIMDNGTDFSLFQIGNYMETHQISADGNFMTKMPSPLPGAGLRPIATLSRRGTNAYFDRQTGIEPKTNPFLTQMSAAQRPTDGEIDSDAQKSTAAFFEISDAKFHIRVLQEGRPWAPPTPISRP